MMPIRANSVGPPSSTTRSRASIAARHSGRSCSRFGNAAMYSPASSSVTSVRPSTSIGSSKDRPHPNRPAKDLAPNRDRNHCSHQRLGLALEEQEHDDKDQPRSQAGRAPPRSLVQKHAISQGGNPGLGICADIAGVCANLLPRRLRARRQSVRAYRSTVDQLHSHRLRRGFSKAVRRVRWPYAQAPSCSARPPSAYLRDPISDSLAVSVGESDQSTGPRGDYSMRERVDPKCAVLGLLFRGRGR
jgi:hypothetical protein